MLGSIVCLPPVRDITTGVGFIELSINMAAPAIVPGVSTGYYKLLNNLEESSVPLYPAAILSSDISLSQKWVQVNVGNGQRWLPENISIT